MRNFIMLFAITSLFFCTSCKKEEGVNDSNQFTNKLTLGTGMNASNFTLIGEGSSFTRIGGTVQIFYRLESASDFGGAAVSIKIEKQSGSNYTLVGTYNYPNPQNYGHIIMSSFNVTESGSFRATGMLTANSATVASTTFTVQ
jgi:hypothetical protein